jgi:hypothetical protein
MERSTYSAMTIARTASSRGDFLVFWQPSSLVFWLGVRVHPPPNLAFTSIQEKFMCMCNLSISQCYTVAYFFFVLLHVIIIFAEIGLHDLGAVVFLPLMAFVINDSINGVH